MVEALNFHKGFAGAHRHTWFTVACVVYVQGLIKVIRHRYSCRCRLQYRYRLFCP